MPRTTPTTSLATVSRLARRAATVCTAVIVLSLAAASCATDEPLPVAPLPAAEQPSEIVADGLDPAPTTFVADDSPIEAADTIGDAEPDPETATPEPPTATPEQEIAAPVTTIPEAPVTTVPSEPCPDGEHPDNAGGCHPTHDDVTTTTTVPEPAPTTTEPAPTTTAVPEPAPTTTAPEPDAGTSDDTESVDEYVWVAPYAGYVPPAHPDTPAPSWEQGTFAVGYQPPDRPRVSEEVQKFIDWCGDYFACDPMLLEMTWALDYLGAAESCIMPLYYTRTLEIEAAGHYLTSGELAERFAWYRCPTVLDPRTPTVTEPAVKAQFPDREVLLLTPNEMSMAERCKTVLPEDVELTWLVNNQLDQLRTGLDCYEWGAFVEAAYKGNNAGCLRSAQLLREWVEHHYGMPISYWRVFC